MDMEEKKLETNTEQNLPVQELPADIPAEVRQKLAEDLNELKRLSAKDILKAEIVTVPGAQYSSKTNAVIRLRAVRKRGQGLSYAFLICFPFFFGESLVKYEMESL